jgi:hypothetical protein
MEIVLDDEVVSNYRFWHAIFQIINESYRIEYYIFKGKNYFNCSSNRYNGKQISNKLVQKNIKLTHKNYICKCQYDYVNHPDHKHYNKIKAKPNDIKYIYTGKFELDIIEDYKKFLLGSNRKMNIFFDNYFHSGNFNLDDLYSKDDIYLFNNDKYYHEVKLTDEFDKTIGLDEKSKKIILDLYKNNFISTSDVKFVSKIDIKLANKNCFNYDHRGLDHCVIELPFLTEINLGKEFTLEDLIISNTNLKSHKFDYWYELYYGTLCANNGDFIEITLNFDHGS